MPFNYDELQVVTKKMFLEQSSKLYDFKISDGIKLLKEKYPASYNLIRFHLIHDTEMKEFIDNEMNASIFHHHFNGAFDTEILISIIKNEMKFQKLMDLWGK